MLKGYDESEKAIIKMMNEKREEFEREHQLAFAREEGSKETLIKNVKTMYKNGFDIETMYA